MEESPYAILYSQAMLESPSDCHQAAKQGSRTSEYPHQSLVLDVGNIGATLPPSSLPGAAGWQTSAPTNISLSRSSASMVSPESLTIYTPGTGRVAEQTPAPASSQQEESFPFSEYSTIWSPQPTFRATQPSVSHTNAPVSTLHQQFLGQTKSFRPPGASVAMQADRPAEAVQASETSLSRSTSLDSAVSAVNQRSRSHSQSSTSSLSVSYHDHDMVGSRSSAFGPAETLTEEEKKKRNRESSQRFRNRTRERQSAIKDRLHYLEDKVKTLERELSMYRSGTNAHAGSDDAHGEAAQIAYVQHENMVLRERLYMAEMQIRALTSPSAPRIGPPSLHIAYSNDQQRHSRQSSIASVSSNMSSFESWSSGNSSQAQPPPPLSVDPALQFRISSRERTDSEMSNESASLLSRSSSLQSYPSISSTSSDGHAIPLSLAYRRPQSLVLPPLAVRSVSAGYASTNFASIPTPTLRTRFPEHNLSSAPPSQASHGFAPSPSNDGSPSM